MQVQWFENLFPMVPDGPDVYGVWRRLIADHTVCGTQAHDARLVALMLVHGIPSILTLNTGHFRRYPSITVVHPAQIVTPDSSIDMSD